MAVASRHRIGGGPDDVTEADYPVAPRAAGGKVVRSKDDMANLLVCGQYHVTEHHDKAWELCAGWGCCSEPCSSPWRSGTSSWSRPATTRSPPRSGPRRATCATCS